MKKYVPSGYQIINVVIDTEGPTISETEELKKYFKNIIEKKEITKPLLLGMKSTYSKYVVTPSIMFDGTAGIILSWSTGYADDSHISSIEYDDSDESIIITL